MTKIEEIAKKLDKFSLPAMDYEKYFKSLESDNEKLKLFQPLPIRNSLVDCYVTINTHALADIFLDRNNEFCKSMEMLHESR